MKTYFNIKKESPTDYKKVLEAEMKYKLTYHLF